MFCVLRAILFLSIDSGILLWLQKQVCLFTPGFELEHLEDYDYRLDYVRSLRSCSAYDIGKKKGLILQFCITSSYHWVIHSHFKLSLQPEAGCRSIDRLILILEVIMKFITVKDLDV